MTAGFPRPEGAAGRAREAEQAGGRTRTPRLLDEDPELGEGLNASLLTEATRRARASVVSLPLGEWKEPTWPASLRNGFGLLVLDGLLLRRIRLGDRVGVELLSRGDLLRPWQRDDAAASVPQQPDWEVLRPCRLAVLDVEFARRVSAFPEITGHLIGRALRRSRWFAVNMAIVQQPKVETRLHMLLWHLADHWGTVGADGVSLPITLTQNVLAGLVAAQRPTVSAALRVLERDGQITRARYGWMLHGPPPGSSGLDS